VDTGAGIETSGAQAVAERAIALNDGNVVRARQCREQLENLR
jgi:hypothetical protein